MVVPCFWCGLDTDYVAGHTACRSATCPARNQPQPLSHCCEGDKQQPALVEDTAEAAAEAVMFGDWL